MSYVFWEFQPSPYDKNWSGIAHGETETIVISYDSNTIAILKANSSGDYSLATQTLPVEARWSGIAYNNGRYVIISLDGEILYSTNGTNWYTATTPKKEWQYVVSTGNGFTVVSRDFNSGAYSESGVNWSFVALPYNVDWLSFYQSHQIFSILGSGFNTPTTRFGAYTEDGSNWVVTEKDNNYLQSFINGANQEPKFIAKYENQYLTFISVK